MILYRGEIREDFEQNNLIERMPPFLYHTLAKGSYPTPETVISACDKLLKRVLDGEFDHVVLPLLSQFDISRARFEQMAQLFSRESLTYKCKIELGDIPAEGDTVGLSHIALGGTAHRKRYPLGILMHVAAGNVDGLPAYSVVEGLLAGNINILKLPSGDSGLSVLLLSELIKAEPSLAEYVYVFDVPSTETETLKTLADLSDAVVVWGGDAAVAAARAMASVNTRIISWGHKLSFAYATPDATDEDLEGLARHICETDQVLCSSCQGIFVDTEDREVQDAFAERFFRILRRVSNESTPVDFGMKSKNAIHIYHERLEAHETGHRIFAADGVSVICKEDRDLELSYMFRNLWVKRLPAYRLVSALKPHKDHLQTAALLCPDGEGREALARLLALSGVVRITHAHGMSRMLSGEAHDGAYPLRQYSRVVETDTP